MQIQACQYSMRALLLLMTVVCIWLGVAVHAARVQRELVKAIEAGGGGVQYNWQVSETGQEAGRDQPPGPTWLRRIVGDDYFQSVVGVYYNEIPLEDDDVPALEHLTSIRFLTFGTTKVSNKTVHRISALSQLKLLDIGFTDASLSS